jgi:hypothetical protein
MVIETDFSFAQAIPGLEGRKVVEAIDLLGPLRPLVGPKPEDPNQHAKRKWRGRGFNLIWRPNFGSQFGPKCFFLQLNLTEEELDFTEITGTGIANRSLFEPTITLGGIAYIQAIKDSFDQTGQHFEPGVWAYVPKTANPKEPSTVVRMGSIPHGTTINLQGTAADPVMTKPTFRPASITPFVGNHDDGETGLIPHPFEEDFSKDNNLSRTDKNRLPGLTRDHLKNPNLFLSDALVNQTVLSTTVLKLSSNTKLGCSVPDVGGGTANIASLTGKGDVHTGGGPNAAAPVVSATFWIEEVRDSDGAEFVQLQYSQRVLLNFEGASWPHITVATLRPVCAPLRDPSDDCTTS